MNGHVFVAKSPSPAVGLAEAPIEPTVGGCGGGESFALRVLGQSMTPEFAEGEIIVIEPDGALHDGSFVLAQSAGEWTFRQLARAGDAWLLRALNPAYADQPLPDLKEVHGVVIQKCVPGRRRLTKHYI